MWIADQNSAGFTTSVTWANAIGLCEDLNYAGNHDWRLPNVRELMSIVNYGATVSPYIDTEKFPHTFSDVYWTSTTYVHDIVISGEEATQYIAAAWGVDFSGGAVNSYDKASMHYVRCVRGGL